MSQDPESPEDKALALQRELAKAHDQLLLYARDLRESLVRERAAHEQLRSYAVDLKAALSDEKQRVSQIERTYLDTMHRLTQAMLFKDRETGDHLRRLSQYAQALTRTLDVEDELAQRIVTCAPMHDLGKIGVPDAVLMKPGPLDESEWEVVKSHPGIGASLLEGSASPLIEVAHQITLTHHEHFDGSGYPRGLSGHEIPLSGRIVMLLDVYDALRSPRVYKPALAHDRCVEIITEGDARSDPKHFDPEVLDAFRELHPVFDAIYEQYSD